MSIDSGSRNGQKMAIMSNRTMRAARIIGSRNAVVEEAPVPAPGEGQVLFRVEGCGVCASNLGPWLGLPWTQYPLLPGESGHEAWGVVESVGKGVQSLAPGDRISALSYNAYAQFDVADEVGVIRLPSSLAAQPFPGEPLACAINIFERSRIEAGHTVAIIGLGFLGAVLTRLASLAGARVIAISKRPFSLTLAAEMGASELIPLEDHQQIIQRVEELTRGRWCDRVIEATGKQWPLDLAGELVKTRGSLVVAGYHQDGARQVNMQLWNWKGLDVINAHERDPERYRQGMQRAVEAVESERLDPSPLFTHRYSLEHLADALDATLERPAGFIKALVIP